MSSFARLACREAGRIQYSPPDGDGAARRSTTATTSRCDEKIFSEGRGSNFQLAEEAAAALKKADAEDVGAAATLRKAVDGAARRSTTTSELTSCRDETSVSKGRTFDTQLADDDALVASSEADDDGAAALVQKGPLAAQAAAAAEQQHQHWRRSTPKVHLR
jgi:hypothetical protein